METWFAPATALDVALQKAGGAPPPAPLIYRGQDSGPMTTAVATSAAIDIGAPAADRRVFVPFVAFATSASIVGATINGITATVVVGTSGASSRLMGLATAIVPTGSTAVAELTLSATGTAYGFGYLTEHGSTSASAYDVTTINAASVNSISLPAGGIDVPVGGFAIAVNWHNSVSAGGETTWSISSGTITEAFDLQTNTNGRWFTVAYTFTSGTALDITAVNGQAATSDQLFAVSWAH